MTSAPISTALAGDNLIVAGQPGLRVLVIAFGLSAGAATVQWKSAGGLALTGPMSLVAPVVAPHGVLTPGGWAGHFETQPGEALVLNNQAASQVSGWVVYALTR